MKRSARIAIMMGMVGNSRPRAGWGGVGWGGVGSGTSGVG